MIVTSFKLSFSIGDGYILQIVLFYWWLSHTPNCPILLVMATSSQSSYSIIDHCFLSIVFFCWWLLPRLDYPFLLMIITSFWLLAYVVDQHLLLILPPPNRLHVVDCPFMLLIIILLFLYHCPTSFLCVLSCSCHTLVLNFETPPHSPIFTLSWINGMLQPC
jgi:hypothetical protein